MSKIYRLSLGKAISLCNIFLKYVRIRKRILNQYSKSVFNRSAFRINGLLASTKGESYLEIGVYSGFTFELVNANQKVAVDPSPRFFKIPSKNHEIHVQTSDAYFANISPKKKFDVIFIDGLHEAFQVYRDIANSVEHLAEEGFILVDDVWPVSRMASISPRFMNTKELELIERNAFSWQGDVFAAIDHLITNCQSLDVTILTSDNHIQAVIRLKGNSETLLAGFDQNSYDEILDKFRKVEFSSELPKYWRIVVDELFFNDGKVAI